MSSKTVKSKPIRNALLVFAIIFVVAFCIRFINLELIKDNPFFNFPTMDEKYHDEWARDIADGQLFSNVPYYRAPAYAYFLGLTYSILGKGYYIPRLIGILIGSLSCVLIYLIAKALFTQRVGLLAAFLACLYGLFIYYDAMLMTVNLEIFFCLACVWWLVKWFRKRNATNIFVSGVFLGLASITRPNFLVFMPVIAVYILLSLKDIPMKKRLSHVSLLILGMAPVVLPITLINILIGKDFVLLAWNGGINFFLGNHQFADGWSATSPELDATWWGGYRDAIVIAERSLGQNNLPASQVSNYWFMRGIDYIISRPLDWLLLMLKKLYLFLNSFELSNEQNIQGFQDFSILLRIPLLNYGTVLAIWGIINSLRKRNKGATLLILLLMAYSFSIIMFFVCARYRAVIVPFLIIFAAYTIVWFARHLMEQKYVRTLSIIVSTIAMIIFFNTDLYGTRVVDRSSIHVSLGNRYFESQNYVSAIEEYTKALAYNARNTDAMNALANTYMMVGWLNQAEKLFKASLSLKRNVDALCKLGVISMVANNMDSARAYYDQAIELNPTDPQVYYYTGMFYAYSKQPRLAIQHLEMALQYYPDPKYMNNIYSNLGKLYMEIGNTDEGTKYLHKAGVK